MDGKGQATHIRLLVEDEEASRGGTAVEGTIIEGPGREKKQKERKPLKSAFEALRMGFEGKMGD